MSTKARPQHHPDEDMRIAYSGGALSEARRMLMLAHLVYCPECRAEAGLMARAGGIMLEDLAPTAMAPNALETCLAAISGPEVKSPGLPAAPERLGELVALPGFVQQLAQKALVSNKWRFASPGVRSLDVSGSVPDAAPGELQIIKIQPGKGVPRHTHTGEELTLVMTGSFKDEFGFYGPGDISFGKPGIVHRPVAEPGDLCYVLAVTDSPLLFKGPLGVIQRVLGF